MNDCIEILDVVRPAGCPATSPTMASISKSFATDTLMPDTRGWLAAALDELDYGIVLVDPSGDVMHVNQAAQTQLEEEHPLTVVANELQARMASDMQPLRVALAEASVRGLRKLLTLGYGCHRATVSIVPLGSSLPENRSGQAVLVILEKRSVCESLSVAAFARSNGLTDAETRVLDALCNGSDAGGVAAGLGVAISTIRTQISAIRNKTGESSVRSLVRRIALLPPIRSSLRQAHWPAANAVTSSTC